MDMQQALRDGVRKAFRQMGNVITEMVYTEFGAAVNDPNTSTLTRPETEHTIKAAPIDYKPAERIGLIQEGDERVFLENVGLGFTPKIGDTVTFRGRTMRIVHVHEHFVGDEIAFYELQLRL